MSTSPPMPPSGREQAHADLFAELVVQHANMALIFVGAVPHPETGEPTQDLEAAQLFIDRLDMLEAKTRGNLGAQETALLKQSLAAARMAFVQAVDQAQKKPAPAAAPSPIVPETKPETADASAPSPEGAKAAEGEAAETLSMDERKKFVKKY